MTFAQAKAIDLAWNALVSQALQTLISIFSYKVFMKVLMIVTEQNSVSTSSTPLYHYVQAEPVLFGG